MSKIKDIVARIKYHAIKKGRRASKSTLKTITKAEKGGVKLGKGTKKTYAKLVKSLGNRRRKRKLTARSPIRVTHSYQLPKRAKRRVKKNVNVKKGDWKWG